MECSTARHLFDLSPAPSSSADAALDRAAAHVEQCPECQDWIARERRADRQIRAALHAVPIPEGLLDQLLSTIGGGHADPERQTAIAPRRIPVPRSSRLVLTLSAACLLLALGGLIWWNLPHSGSQPMAFEAALKSLSGRFADPQQSADSWEALPVWDLPPESLASLDSLARRLNRFDPRGIDLDGQPGFEGVAYRFTSGSVEGVLIVLPTTKIGLAPPTPVSSSQLIYTWASPLGDQSYICFIHAGRADDLRELLRSA